MTGVRALNIEDAKVAQAMANCADHVLVVADSSKVGKSASVQILEWDDTDELVTNSLPSSMREALVSHGVTVRCVKGQASV